MALFLTLEVARVAGGIYFARVRVLAAKQPFSRLSLTKLSSLERSRGLRRLFGEYLSPHYREPARYPGYKKGLITFFSCLGSVSRKSWKRFGPEINENLKKVRVLSKKPVHFVFIVSSY